MNLFYKILFSSILFFYPVLAYSFSIENAYSIASNLLDTTQLIVAHQNDSYVILGRESRHGFVVVSMREDAIKRIIGYSECSSWKLDDMPPVLLALLESSRILKDHLTLKSLSYKTTINNRRSIVPLLSCHWHQQSPYNDFAPVIEDC